MSSFSPLRWLGFLLFPPVCPGCGSRHDIFREPEPPLFCPACRRAWLAVRETPCPVCALPAALCSCMPRTLQKAGCRAYIHLVPYNAANVAGRLILQCKQYRDRENFSFLADQLTALLRERLPLSSGAPGEFLLTNVPRRRQAVRRFGHDQARVLAKAMKKASGIPYLPLLIRRRDGQAQKKLSARERRESAACAWQSDKRRQNALKGKTVLLVDDICTTGESLAACTGLLLEAGAGAVIAVTVGKSELAGSE